MSQFGSNTNFVSKINSVKYDLNSLFVSSGLVNLGDNTNATIYTGNTNLETVTFTKEGNYIVLLTGTPNNLNDKQTRYQLVFSTTSEGFTGTTGDINAVYIQNFLGGNVNPEDATVSGCAVINVSSAAYTWYLALRINGNDGTNFRYQLSIIGPI